jgi:rRNA maturation endonuclease Nob1
MFCKDICTHFLSITKSKKVVRRFGKQVSKDIIKNYKKCGYCEIQLRTDEYDQCPCCGHKRLTINLKRFARRSEYFKTGLKRI